MKMSDLSVVLAVFNEEKNLTSCLEAVKSIADEIVIVDGGSTDNTVKIAREFKAKVIITSNPPIFHINKQKAIDQASKKWILQLDADEIITEELKKEIVKTINDPENIYSAFYIKRRNKLLGRFMKKTVMYPDPVIRFFKKGNQVPVPVPETFPGIRPLTVENIHVRLAPGAPDETKSGL